MTFRGVRFIESLYHTEAVEDYSACRSPSRAKRRLKRGIVGRVKVRQVPRKDATSLDGVNFIIHPVTLRAAREHLETFAKDWSAGNITPKFHVDRPDGQHLGAYS